MQGTKVIRVYNEGLKKLDRINSERPQDMSRADTFEYVMRVFEESPLRIERGMNPIPAKYAKGSVTSPIIDADDMSTLAIAEKIVKDTQREIARLTLAEKMRNEAPTKNNLYKESKE